MGVNRGNMNVVGEQLPPNKPLELTPLRVRQDRPDFEGWIWLDGVPDLEVRRSSCPDRWAARPVILHS
jgi:hypothetical protein